MVAYAYPRLPARIPYWLNLAGSSLVKLPKTGWFFLYPLFQTIFILTFWLVSQVWIKRPEFFSPKIKKEKEFPSNDEDKIITPKIEQPEKLEQIIAGQNIRNEPIEISSELAKGLRNLKMENVLLNMIFINLIFIHLQRGLIWLAHGLSPAVNKPYLFSLFIVILLLIPYYRFRRSLLLKMSEHQ
ncbi:MAG: hypothetical protein ACPLZD_04320 [Candidatus Saccharicenans sp.]|nr:MAG: hypothetical protein C0168_05995 [Candidatus Aminicenantes bacterium]HEK84806.1 hypothetical protein [Candidatus Aminicenantes bacterium]